MTRDIPEPRAAADARSSKSAAGADTGLGQRYQYADDSSRVSDFDKDTGADERIESSGATIHDAMAVQQTRMSFLATTSDQAEINQRIRHAEQLFQDQRMHQAKVNSLEIAEREQRIKFAEGNHTAQMFQAFGFVADTVQEAFANRVADRVVERVK